MSEFWDMFHIPICIIVGIVINRIVTKLYYRHKLKAEGR